MPIPKDDTPKPGLVYCEHCLFWSQFTGTVLGECHRYAPRPSLISSDAASDVDVVAVWPQTVGDEWCAEGKPTP